MPRLISGLQDEEVVAALKEIARDVACELRLLDDDGAYEQRQAAILHKYNSVLQILLCRFEKDARFPFRKSLLDVINEERAIATAETNRAHAECERLERDDHTRACFLKRLKELVDEQIKEYGAAPEA